MSTQGSQRTRTLRGTPPTTAAATLLGVAVALAALMAAGCDGVFQSTDRYTIRVDSISAPASVASSETLFVRFFGFVGPSGCWWLESVDRRVTTSSLDVTFRGAHRNVTCTQAVVYLDRRDTVPPPLAGPFTITAHQPDGSVVKRAVAVQ